MLFFQKVKNGGGILSALCFTLLSCTAQTTPPSIVSNETDNHKVLIVVLSRTGNTKAVADMIQKQVGGTMVVLSLVTPYPQVYRAQVDQVVRENETGYLPPLATTIDSIMKYDLIFVGFPTWAMKLPPPIKSFLSSYDLRDKIVIPFNTNAGYGVGSSFDTFRRLCGGCAVLEGFSTKGGVERDGVLLAIKGSRKEEVNKEVSKWIKSLQLDKLKNRK